MTHAHPLPDPPTLTLLAWSGGKDSAMALDVLKRTPGVEVVALLTTLTEGYDRISMHGVRETLLDAQAKSLGMPLHKVFIPQDCTNEIYQQRMEAATRQFHAEGVAATAFGDLFLEDVRAYREANLAKVPMQALFPVWGRETGQFARDFIERGFKAILVCVDPRVLDASFAGREVDASLLADLPQGVDPCGENGEFHTFVYDGPIFAQRILVQRGEVVTRGGFVFCDLLPAD